MPETTEGHLNVQGPESSWRLPLNPDGMLIGRHRDCDVVLRSGFVSRRHACLFRDPFGRWIVEDLGGRQGVFLKGERVTATVVAPGEPIRITPFILTVAESPAGAIPADPNVSTTTTLLEDAEEAEVVAPAPAPDAALSADRLRELNQIGDALAALTDARHLYPKACQCLAEAPNTAALVLRLGRDDTPPANSPEVLAAHLLGPQGEPAAGEANLHLSRRVLEAVRSRGTPVMGRSRTRSESDLGLTLADPDEARAVLAVPVTDAGEPIETLYVDMPEPCATPEAVEFIRAVGRQVRFVRKGLLLAEAKAERQVLDHQLEMARKIQLGLTPSHVPDVPGVDLAFCCRPALWVGGDYCDVWPLSDGRLAFAVGDVCGKGLPAAMVMANLQAVLRTATDLCGELATAMERVNSHLVRHLPMGVFVTLFLGLYDPAEGHLAYVNAGHIPPWRVGPGGHAAQLRQPENTVLGIREEPFVINAVDLQPEAALVAVTDGVTECRSPAGDEFGREGVAKVINRSDAETAAQLVEAVTEATDRFRGPRPAQDDLTVLAIRRCSPKG